MIGEGKRTNFILNFRGFMTENLVHETITCHQVKVLVFHNLFYYFRGENKVFLFLSDNVWCLIKYIHTLKAIFKIFSKNTSCFHLSCKMHVLWHHMSRTKDHYAKVVDIFQASIKQKNSAENLFLPAEIRLSLNVLCKKTRVLVAFYLYTSLSKLDHVTRGAAKVNISGKTN